MDARSRGDADDRAALGIGLEVDPARQRADHVTAGVLGGVAVGATETARDDPARTGLGDESGNGFKAAGEHPSGGR